MMGFRAETERSFQKLAEAQTVTQAGLDRLGGVIGDMQRTLGSTVEEEAQGVLIDTLEKKGYHLIEEAYNLSLDGEVDVVQAVRDQDGRPLWALAEVKVRLGPGAVEAWANRSKSEGFRLQLSEAGIPGPYLVYVFGLRVERRAFEAAETFGIGLLRGRGEAVMPKGEIAGVK